MRFKVLVFAAVITAGVALVSAQAQRTAATLDDVVNEIRAMRADLQRTTRATTQMQLLTARLQLQEQRITVLSNQRNDITTRLALAAQGRLEAERQAQIFEENKGRNQELGVSRQDLEAQQQAFQRAAESNRGLERQLQTQESQLAAEIATEQGRWQDFNNRLDALERSLR